MKNSINFSLFELLKKYYIVFALFYLLSIFILSNSFLDVMFESNNSLNFVILICNLFFINYIVTNIKNIIKTKTELKLLLKYININQILIN
jgi:hypothetical protein